MSFYRYTIKRYLNENSLKGDLARDMKADKNFPINSSCKFDGWKMLIREYLESQGACYDCLLVFDEVWKEYEICEKKRLNRYL